MMNTIKTYGTKPFLFSVLLTLLTACHKDDVEIVPDNHSLPVVLTTNVSKVQTKVAESAFEDGDEIGLFLLEQPNTLSDDRYADNLRFVCRGADWVPDEALFFPSGESKSNFIAYYPYLPGGLSERGTSLSRNVKSDQDKEHYYSLSDFLVATLNDVEPREDAVPLVFKHKLTCVEIVINPGTAYSDAQKLLDAHPVVTIKNVSTSVDYDFLTGAFNNPTQKSDIIPAGSFIVKENKLVGKKAIIVPQIIPGGHILIELSVDGKNYSFTLGEAHEYIPATREICTLTLRSAASSVPGKIVTSVVDWENNKEYSGDLTENIDSDGIDADYYSVVIPDFSESSVYKVMNGNVQIAEVCREYLKSTGIDNQIIAAYPFRDGKTDMSKGTILQVLDGNAGNPLPGNVHGGTISWNASTHLPTYKKGTSAYLSVVYIDTKGVFFTAVEGKNPAPATLKPDLLEDPRDNIVYSVVKIGTQYWMGQNLKATQFVNGEAIPLKENKTEWKAAPVALCHYKATSEILYNFGAVTSQIAPENWKIPSKAEWEQLVFYTEANPILLESANWNIINNKLNLTGFSASKTGIRQETGDFYEDAPGFWHNEGGYACFINNNINVMSNETSSGCSLRLLRD